MRKLYFLFVFCFFIYEQAIANGTDGAGILKYNSSCAKIENSDVIVRRDGVYAKVNAIIDGGKKSIFFIKKDKKNEEILLMVDGKKHEINYVGENIYNIGKVCL